MNFNCEEQIGGFNNVEVYTLEETSGWPKVVTDHNSDLVTFTPIPQNIEGTILNESIDVRESSAVKDPGNLHDVSISFEFLSQSPALEQLLDSYSSTKLVAVVCKNYKQKKLYGTNTFPLQLTYELKHGKKPEDGTATIIKLTGQSPKRSVHILNEVG